MFNLFIHSLIHLFTANFLFHIVFRYSMLKATWGGGRLLMTYQQWRSLDDLTHSSKNSFEIPENNRRVVFRDVGGRKGGFVAVEALHSNGLDCLE